jgi:hypothetical protein
MLETVMIEKEKEMSYFPQSFFIRNSLDILIGSSNKDLIGNHQEFNDFKGPETYENSNNEFEHKQQPFSTTINSNQDLILKPNSLSKNKSIEVSNRSQDIDYSLNLFKKPKDSDPNNNKYQL